MVQSFLVHFTEVSNPGAAEISFYFSYSRNKLIYRFTVAYARKIDLSDKDSILSYQRPSSLFFFFLSFIHKLEHKTDLKISEVRSDDYNLPFMDRARNCANSFRRKS